MKDFKVYQASGYLTKLVTDASDVRKTYDEISGSLVEFDTPISAPLAELVVDINPVQDLHGQDAPYPAGGGKNLLPFIGNSGTSGVGVVVDYDEASQTYTLNGTTDSAGNMNLSYIPPSDLPLSADPSGSYIISVTVVSGSMTLGEGSGNTFAVALFNSSNNAFLRGPINGTTLNGYWGYRTEALESTGNYVLIFQCWRVGTVFSNLNIRVQIEKGSSSPTTPTAWSPYSNICPITGWTSANVYHSGEDTSDPTTYTISWQDDAGTVYGGAVDLVSGVLTSKMESVDLGTQDWTKGNFNNITYFTCVPNGIKPATAIGTLMNASCDRYKLIPSVGVTTSFVDYSFFVWTNGTLYLRDDNFINSTAAEFKTAMSGVQLVYELATPIEIQLTPQEINTRVGVNNIWADTGDVSVKYRTH